MKYPFLPRPKERKSRPIFCWKSHSDSSVHQLAADADVEELRRNRQSTVVEVAETFVSS
jgi:hypothetical protein